MKQRINELPEVIAARLRLDATEFINHVSEYNVIKNQRLDALAVYQIRSAIYEGNMDREKKIFGYDSTLDSLATSDSEIVYIYGIINGNVFALFFLDDDMKNIIGVITNSNDIARNG
jgi:hypothetical protein